ncbi:MAG: hypothetical protein WA431_16735 [Candidatus Cybelea sp.]
MSSPILTASAAAAALATVLFAGAPGSRSVALAATPPPTPPPIGGTPATPAPTPTASFYPAPEVTPTGMPRYKPTPSPPPNARKGLDGVWEVAIQHPATTDYTHFAIKQDGDALNGTYLDAHGKRFPLVGTVDGQNVRLIVTMPNGTTILMEGRLDGTTDMIGMLTLSDAQVPFTASYRAKEKWIENVSPSAGGIPSSNGSYTPP